MKRIRVSFQIFGKRYVVVNVFSGEVVSSGIVDHELSLCFLSYKTFSLLKMWPSRDVKMKYSVNDFGLEETGSVQSKNSGSNSSGFWSRLSVFTSSNDNDNGNKSESSSPDKSPNSSPRESTDSPLDSLYNDAPQMKTNRKVYTENPFGLKGRIKTRRESIMSNNRRFICTSNSKFILFIYALCMTNCNCFFLMYSL